MMTLIVLMAASSLKDKPSAIDLTITKSPVAWFVTRYGASSSQRPNIEKQEYRKEINPCSHGPHHYG